MPCSHTSPGRPPTLLIVVTAVIALAATLTVGCAPRGPAALRVGMELAYPPFEMTDTDGKPAGISVRLAEALGRHLGRPVTIENIAFDGLIPALKTGKIDCIISSMTATPQRAESIAFSRPYVRSGLTLLVAKDSPVRSVADLDAPDRTVVVKKGTIGHGYATDSLTRAKVLVLDKESAAVLEVVQGKADAFIYDPLSVCRNQARHPDSTRAILDIFGAESWAIGLRRGDDALKAEVDRFLDRFRAEGGFERLADEFLAEEKRVFAAKGIPFFF
ncbi:MAG: transporter substrate-binding domain-containing protein [Planctomycetaceae bacterium]